MSDKKKRSRDPENEDRPRRKKRDLFDDYFDDRDFWDDIDRSDIDYYDDDKYDIDDWSRQH